MNLSLPLIAAVATPPGAGGIAVIRVSGEGAVDTVAEIFKAKNGRSLAELSGYRAAYGKIFDGDTAVDDVVCLVFRAPHSFTGEDTVEISCHGGDFVTKRVLRAVIAAGASPAQAGEFTKRAFLSGKLDLTEAEAVAEIISSEGEAARAAALNALDGALRRKLEGFVSVLVASAANISAFVDYPDDEIPELDSNVLISQFNAVRKGLSELILNYDSGRAVTRGVDTVIAGRPNVGKSTLMNLLSGCERSIVTSHAGTTRDVVEETVQLGRLTLRLADTAGLHETDDPVESIGVSRAKTKLERASLVLAVFDGSREPDNDDLLLLDKCKNKPVVAVINKTDLPQKLDASLITSRCAEAVFVSAASGEGAQALSDAVERLLGTKSLDSSAALLANERQLADCREALACVDETLSALRCGMTLDAVSVSIEGAVGALLSLTGKRASEAVIEDIFSRFCVGK